MRVYWLRAIIILFLRSIHISDSGNIDELELRRRQKRAVERAAKKDDEDPPKTRLEPERGGSAPPPHGKKTAVGAGDEDDRIPRYQVRLIDENGTQVGIVSFQEAVRTAKERSMKLIIVQPDANPPVAKIMNYSRYKFELEKKVRETKRKHHIVDVKEIKMRYKIEEHDYQVKLRNAQKFLGAGDHIKVVTILREREMEHKDMAMKLMQKFAEELKECATLDREPKVEGKSVLMILSPHSG